MAGRKQSTFKKRQKEQQRKERKEEKFAKRMARKHQNPGDEPQPEHDAPEPENRPAV
jgi:hypothetical protein